jgi:hypothetical protein
VIFLLYIGYHPPIWVLVLWSILFFSGSLGFARIRADAGMPSKLWIANDSGGLSASIYRLFPNSAGESAACFSASMTFMQIFLPAQACHATDSYKLSGDAKLSRKSVTFAILFSIVLTYLLHMALSLNYAYDLGVGNAVYPKYLNTQWLTQLQEVRKLMEDPSPARFEIAHMIFGPIFVIFLLWMRARYVWWPLHPVGFLSIRGVGRYYGVTAFVVWLIKTLSYRWGSKALVDKLKPFFVGLIIGDAGMTILFYLIKVVLPA